MQNFYKVVAKCGHVGKRKYIPIQFAVKAENGKDAAKMVRSFPRVKHNNKFAILQVEKIDFEDYIQINIRNHKDPYLLCHSKQEQQRSCDLTERIEIDFQNEKTKIDKQVRKEKVKFKLKKFKQITKSDLEEIYEYIYKFN